MKSKKVVISIILVLIILILNMTVYAGGTIDTDIQINKGDAADYQGFADFTGKALSILRAIGVVVSVVALAITGIVYMTSSAQEKAVLKGKFVLYVVGALLVFSTTTIVDILYKFIVN